jgi:TonB family protein
MPVWTVVALLIVCLADMAWASPSEAGACDFSSFKPVRISEFIPKAVVKKVLPEYPDGAIKRRQQGRVTVKVLIKLDGTVERACAAVGGPFAAAAEKAAKQSLFKRNFGFDQPRYGDYAEANLVFIFVIKNGRGEVGAVL